MASENDIKTVRTILSALTFLADGYDVVIVAHPAAEAFEIADRVFGYANLLEIPCELPDDNKLHDDRDVPSIVTRPYTWEPDWSTVVGVKPKVVIDHSARFEKAGEWSMSRSVRPVHVLESLTQRILGSLTDRKPIYDESWGSRMED